jgi:hypothetical protein
MFAEVGIVCGYCGKDGAVAEELLDSSAFLYPFVVQTNHHTDLWAHLLMGRVVASLIALPSR